MKIEPIKTKGCGPQGYNWYAYGGFFEFKWSDWVLCKIAKDFDNVYCWSIASSFNTGFSSNGATPGVLTCHLYGYGSGHKPTDFVSVESFVYFEPVRIIEEFRNPVFMDSPKSNIHPGFYRLIFKDGTETIAMVNIERRVPYYQLPTEGSERVTNWSNIAKVERMLL